MVTFSPCFVELLIWWHTSNLWRWSSAQERSATNAWAASSAPASPNESAEAVPFLLVNRWKSPPATASLASPRSPQWWEQPRRDQSWTRNLWRHSASVEKPWIEWWSPRWSKYRRSFPLQWSQGEHWRGWAQNSNPHPLPAKSSWPQPPRLSNCRRKDVWRFVEHNPRPCSSRRRCTLLLAIPFFHLQGGFPSILPLCSTTSHISQQIEKLTKCLRGSACGSQDSASSLLQRWPFPSTYRLEWNLLLWWTS